MTTRPAQLLGLNIMHIGASFLKGETNEKDQAIEVHRFGVFYLVCIDNAIVHVAADLRSATIRYNEYFASKRRKGETK